MFITELDVYPLNVSWTINTTTNTTIDGLLSKNAGLVWSG